MKQMMVLVSTIILGIVICVAILGFRTPVRTMDDTVDSAIGSDGISGQATSESNILESTATGNKAGNI